MPDGPPPPPVVQRVRLRYAKRARLRFTSHRDFARAFERALRRAGVPMAYSAGFTPHPKVSYVGAAPTGVASEAEYLEIGLAREVDVEQLRSALDRALPPGIDIVEAVRATGGSLPERIDASEWQIELPGVDPSQARTAVAALLAAETVPVERRTKAGQRSIDVRSALVSAVVAEEVGLAGGDGVAPLSGVAPAELGVSTAVTGSPCAIIICVVRHLTPAVRPDDFLTGLRQVADLDPAEFPVPPRATRMAQGALTAEGRIADPLDADRGGLAIGTPT
ncbi:TIGR03936 family radical SAM-associated protein [Cryptosporangium aurantiacum]|uniref:Radical SAM-linked protein n=1 Tax=Cryptosporangium aurantiacum TaxID=134849 RepID=A0A1M7Q6I7_9ACTN|nr:TIGR03936 family radical SAM-associated protein [Cryptosporangium aurantiacum]SHN26091.1 radical SAM-linked protein [Cryptosporangium aurantiacum]